MILFLAFPAGASAELGPKEDLSVPTCEEVLGPTQAALELCQVAKEKLAAENKALYTLADKKGEQFFIAEGQRDRAYEREEKSGAPLISTELAAGTGAVAGALITLLVVAIAGGRK